MYALLFPSLISLVVFSIGYIPIFTVLYFVKRSHSSKRTPLTSQLLRSPGSTLQKAIDDATDEIQTYVTFIPLMWLMGYASYISMLYLKIIKSERSVAIGILIAFVGCTIYFGYKLYKFLMHRNKLRLGLDGEMMVGQELNQLMTMGCRVFHDFPAEDFNIDHVVVGPNGVFAVETKARAKSDKNRGKDDVRVEYDGTALKFPGWQETKPIEQAKRQAQWLSKWITSSIGESIVVKPVLALPGWYVERTKKDDLFVINGKNPVYLAQPQDLKTALPATTIKIISSLIEQRCRDVEPTAYKKAKKNLASP
jgi:hypothetical protein